jgi:hypothetical protein
MCFGSSGMFEQDDVENWTSITQMARGQMAERLNLHNRMGLLRDGRTVSEPIDWPAPGRAYTGFGEFNQRELLSQWCDLMEGALADGSGNGRVGGPADRVATLD